jgi:hypothetical protein
MSSIIRLLDGIHIQRLNALSMAVPGIPLALWWIYTSEDYIQYVAIPYIWVCICSYMYHMHCVRHEYMSPSWNPEYLRWDITAQQILAYATLLVVPSNAATITVLLVLFPLITGGNLKNEIQQEISLTCSALTIIFMGFHFSFKCGMCWILTVALYCLPTKYAGVLWHLGCQVSIHTAGVALLKMRSSR